MSPKRRIAGLRAATVRKNFFSEDFPSQLSIESFLPLSKSSQWPTDIDVPDIGETASKKTYSGLRDPKSFHRPTLSQELHGLVLLSFVFIPGKSQGVAERRTLHNFVRPLVVPREFHTHRKVRTAFHQ